ncbi:MAG: hypothetical protein MI892_19895, partial [Desulfobacterales bacterium]|nr:hypothetical protein [Desulfobacterales bacterium]
QDIYGGEEFGPYTIEISGLNTAEVKNALANGYVPQVHVVSYDLSRVSDSNYNPGVNNLKIVEESAKGRTATIKIMGKEVRDIHRVCAFDVDSSGNIVPGVSLKKALFNIFKKRVGQQEEWVDSELTVPDAGLRWKTGDSEHQYSANTEGNSWNAFETYVKEYQVYETDTTDGSIKAITRRIETIKRIGEHVKWNPFNPDDNTAYDPNGIMTEEEINSMKYWVILHNGKFFNGDINDPIWAGDRFEIIFVDVQDFNQHFRGFAFDPLQSGQYLYLNTRWNRLSNEGELDRALYLGKVINGDVVKLEVDLAESRFLFDSTSEGRELGPYSQMEGLNGLFVNDFQYTFEGQAELPTGKPGQ